jgi:DNA invertase Pin-like site-specific DNA recombinase
VRDDNRDGPRPIQGPAGGLRRLLRKPSRPIRAEAPARAARGPRGTAGRPAPPGTGGRAIGYAAPAPDTQAPEDQLREQATVIERACEARGLTLLSIVRDAETAEGSGHSRPALGYALEQLAAGKASCLVVAELERLSASLSDLGLLLTWFEQGGRRLVAADLGLDTATAGGQLAARALLSVSAWERERLSERTRKGLAAARAKGASTGRPAVADKPALRRRIVQMREGGMTLQAIADALNDEGVPTLRGGSQWRPSSVQSATGYKRRRKAADRPLPGAPVERPEEVGEDAPQAG